MMTSRIFSNLEEFFLQFRHGMIPEEEWIVYRKFGQTMLENPLIDRWWKSGVTVFTSAFVLDLTPEFQPAEWTPRSAARARGDDA